MLVTSSLLEKLIISCWIDRKMPAVPGSMYQGQGPSCFDKMKMGFYLGFAVGMASGALFGGFSALRWGQPILHESMIIKIKFKHFRYFPINISTHDNFVCWARPVLTKLSINLLLCIWGCTRHKIISYCTGCGPFSSLAICWPDQYFLSCVGTILTYEKKTWFVNIGYFSQFQ